MSTKYRLYCTRCDTPVAFELVDYEGYRASCRHARYALNVGSGERPPLWAQRKDIESLSGFKITTGEWEDDGFVGCEAICTKCDGSEHVEVTFESVDMEHYDMKATLECTGGHKRGRTNTDVTYTDIAHERGDFWPERHEATPDYSDNRREMT